MPDMRTLDLEEASRSLQLTDKLPRGPRYDIRLVAYEPRYMPIHGRLFFVEISENGYSNNGHIDNNRLLWASERALERFWGIPEGDLEEAIKELARVDYPHFREYHEFSIKDFDGL